MTYFISTTKKRGGNDQTRMTQSKKKKDNIYWQTSPITEKGPRTLREFYTANPEPCRYKKSHL